MGGKADSSEYPTTYSSTTCTYDPENRMTAYGSALTAGYDGDGLRAWKNNGTTATYFLYDGDKPVCELSSAGSVTATNVFGASGLVARTVSSTTTLYTFDPQGSVAQRLSTSGTVSASDCYNAWGSRSSTGSADVFQYGAQWGYYTDGETGLVLCTHRYYDPGTGRWLTRDPFGVAGGVNLYGYCGNEPADAADPSGYFGAGLVAGGTADIGYGPGLGVTGSVGIGVFGGGGKGPSVGGLASGGAFAGSPVGGGVSAPSLPSCNGALGGFVGVGRGVFITSADSASELSGPFYTYNVNFGYGPIGFGLQFGTSGGTWILGITAGPGAGLAGSGYPTTTVTT